METDSTTIPAEIEQQEQPQSNRVTFTPEQQARVDEIIRDAMGRAGREARTHAEQATQRLKALEAELTATKQRLESTQTPTGKSDAKGDADALKAQIDEMKAASQTAKAELEASEHEIQSLRAEALNTKRDAALHAALSKHAFFNAEMVAEVLRDDVQVEDGRVIVKGKNGPRLNHRLEPMTLDELCAEFAAKNPYMVRGELRGGIGSSEAQKSALGDGPKLEELFGRNSNAELANRLAQKNIAEYRRLKAQAQAKGLLG